MKTRTGLTLRDSFEAACWSVFNSSASWSTRWVSDSRESFSLAAFWVSPLSVEASAKRLSERWLALMSECIRTNRYRSQRMSSLWVACFNVSRMCECSWLWLARNSDKSRLSQILSQSTSKEPFNIWDTESFAKVEKERWLNKRMAKEHDLEGTESEWPLENLLSAIYK